MLLSLHPKLPMRDKTVTRAFYIDQLGFEPWGSDYPDYLMLEKDGLQIHFFQFSELNPAENYGQIYLRADDINALYTDLKSRGVRCMPLETKPWGQKEFSLLDPDHNLLTFGQGA